MRSRSWEYPNAACQALAQSRGLQRRRIVRADDEAALTEDIIKLAKKYVRYGYKRITALLRVQGSKPRLPWVTLQVPIISFINNMLSDIEVLRIIYFHVFSVYMRPSKCIDL